MTKSKIIPKKPFPLEDAQEYPSFQVFNRSTAEFSQYIKFIETWGGGNVYPCVMPLPEGVKSKTGQTKAVVVQSIVDPMRVEDDHDDGLRGEYWSEQYRPIARINQGDHILMKVEGNDLGSIYYWTQKNDGINYTTAKVANDFHSFLDLLYEDYKVGSTNPWTSMKSVDDSPAVDFVYR
ncbi:MAG: SMI1/KNR4 family protein [Arenicella sp.]